MKKQRTLRDRVYDLRSASNQLRALVYLFQMPHEDESLTEIHLGYAEILKRIDRTVRSASFLIEQFQIEQAQLKSKKEEPCLSKKSSF